MDIPLSPEQQQFINERLASGRNHTAQEVVAEALSLLQSQDNRDRARLVPRHSSSAAAEPVG
jgi:putative addiction module CopG family antidote